MSRVFFSIVFLLFLSSFPQAEELRISLTAYPGSLNPVYATDEISQMLVNKVFAALYAFDGQGRIGNDLTEGESWDEKRLQAVIRLRRNAFFSNGQKLQSADVLATYRLLTDDTFAYPYRADLGFIAGLERVDDYSLRLRLRRKFAPWKSYLTFKVLCAEQLKAARPETFKDKLLLGTGPYRFDHCQAATAIWLRKNPCYAKKCSFALIRFEVLLDQRQAPLKLWNGETDAAELQAEDVQAFFEQKEWQKSFALFPYRRFGYTYLAFNVRNPRQDKNLRRIVYNRIIASSFLERFLAGQGEKVATPFLYLAAEIKPRVLPAQPLPAPVRLRLLTNSESRLRRSLALFLAAELRQDNILLEPLFLEYHAFFAALRQGDFDLGLSGFVLDMDWNLRDVLGTDGVCNYMGFSMPAMDRLLDDGLQEMDEKKRRQIYLRAHGLWQEELPLLPLFNYFYYVGVRTDLILPRAGCHLVGSSGDFFFDLERWQVRKSK